MFPIREYLFCFCVLLAWSFFYSTGFFSERPVTDLKGDSKILSGTFEFQIWFAAGTREISRGTNG